MENLSADGVVGVGVTAVFEKAGGSRSLMDVARNATAGASASTSFKWVPSGGAWVVDVGAQGRRLRVTNCFEVDLILGSRLLPPPPVTVNMLTLLLDF